MVSCTFESCTASQKLTEFVCDDLKTLRFDLRLMLKCLKLLFMQIYTEPNLISTYEDILFYFLLMHFFFINSLIFFN